MQRHRFNRVLEDPITKYCTVVIIVSVSLTMRSQPTRSHHGASHHHDAMSITLSSIVNQMV